MTPNGEDAGKAVLRREQPREKQTLQGTEPEDKRKVTFRDRCVSKQAKSRLLREVEEEGEVAQLLEDSYFANN